MKKVLPLALLLVSQIGFANVGAVIDSGVDFTHDKLKNKAWINIQEIVDNKIDDDMNGKIDDINGWNYVLESGEIFDKSIVFNEPIYGSIQRFFQLQDRYERRLISIEELAELRGINSVHKKEVNLFGENSHGTHVAGIMTRDNEQSKVIALKIISTDLESFVALETERIMREEKPIETGTRLQRFIMKFVMRRLGALKAKELGEYGAYIKGYGTRVANCSWGTSFEDMKKAVTMVAERIFCKKDTNGEYKCDGEPITKEELNHYTALLMDKMNSKGESMMDKASNTLFVFAAGNDGTDNDKFPSYPANVEDSNTLTVAATIDDYDLAEFSNYGAKTVDVAAPGVGILSTTPQNKMCMMTGTSQATPYVANVALKASEINSKLTAKDIKKIIVKTVDKKAFLRGKVSSEGVVNMKRALRAAELSKTLHLNHAIRRATKEVPEGSVKRQPLMKRVLEKMKVIAAPTIFH